MSQTGWTDKRPMSPHLSIWRWHVTMLGSILHRATGVVNYAGVFLVVAWLVTAAMGPDYYRPYAALLATLPGQIVLFGFTLSVTYHLFNGVRHLFLDMGAGFGLRTANLSGWIVLILAVATAAAIWLFSGYIPGVSVQ